jgi:hypothetical protein
VITVITGVFVFTINKNMEFDNIVKKILMEMPVYTPPMFSSPDGKRRSDVNYMIKRDKYGKKLGKLGHYDLRVLDSDKYKFFYVMDGKRPIYEMRTIDSKLKDNKGKKIYNVVYVESQKNEFDFIIAADVYYFIVNDLGFVVQSDTVQSLPSVRTWLNLIKRPGLKIEEYNVDTGELKQIDTSNKREIRDLWEGPYSSSTRIRATKI